MKKKKLNFFAHPTDIRAITANVLSLILNRFGDKYHSASRNLNEAVGSSDNIEVLEVLQELVDVFEETIKEIESCSDLVECIQPVEKKEDENTQTEDKDPKKTKKKNTQE
tara:strand:- start:32 stop:361 length:330 start_codon:yes stop_codon:yes gene_type:complete